MHLVSAQPPMSGRAALQRTGLLLRIVQKQQEALRKLVQSLLFLFRQGPAYVLFGGSLKVLGRFRLFVHLWFRR